MDWIKGRFVLIATNENDWQLAYNEVKQQLSIDIHLVTIEEESVLEEWKALTNTTSNKALLIRPDDFVAANLTSGNLVVQFVLSR